jgi:peptidoglycan/LPS O-acetylase OafA/YrhL
VTSPPVRVADERSTTRDPRIPALDGLRGIAILMVMVHHFAANWPNDKHLATPLLEVAYAGWAGVDLFFVLSGFLITGLLIETRGARHYFRNFYMRRVLRIFPLYYGVLIAIFVLAPLIRPASPGLQDLASRQQWLWFYAVNVHIAITGDWQFTTGWIDLGHFWSLAVEEHFYLVWPAVVLWLRPRTLLLACIAMIPFALAVRLALVSSGLSPTAAYVFTPARLGGLAVGSGIAVLAHLRGGIPALVPAARVVAIAAGLAIAGMIVAMRGLIETHVIMRTVGYPVLALFFGALLVFAADPRATGIFARACSARWLRMLGVYSYGLYVFHVPLRQLYHDVFGVNRLLTIVSSPSLAVMLFTILAMLCTLAVAMLSWHLYEVHFIRLKRFFPYGESVAK